MIAGGRALARPIMEAGRQCPATTAPRPPTPRIQRQPDTVASERWQQARLGDGTCRAPAASRSPAALLPGPPTAEGWRSGSARPTQRLDEDHLQVIPFGLAGDEDQRRFADVAVAPTTSANSKLQARRGRDKAGPTPSTPSRGSPSPARRALRGDHPETDLPTCRRPPDCSRRDVARNTGPRIGSKLDLSFDGSEAMFCAT